MLECVVTRRCIIQHALRYSYLSLKSWLWSSSCSSSVFVWPLFLSLRFLSWGSKVSRTTRLGWSRSLGHRYTSEPSCGRLHAGPLTAVAMAYAAVLCQNLQRQITDGELELNDRWLFHSMTLAIIKYWVVRVLIPAGSTTSNRRKGVSKQGDVTSLQYISASFTCQRWQASSCLPGLFALQWCSSPERRRPCGWGVALDQRGLSSGRGTGEGSTEEWPPESPSETLSEWSCLWWQEGMGEKKGQTQGAFPWNRHKTSFFISLLNLNRVWVDT